MYVCMYLNPIYTNIFPKCNYYYNNNNNNRVKQQIEKIQSAHEKEKQDMISKFKSYSTTAKEELETGTVTSTTATTTTTTTTTTITTTTTTTTTTFILVITTTSTTNTNITTTTTTTTTHYYYYYYYYHYYYYHHYYCYYYHYYYHHYYYYYYCVALANVAEKNSLIESLRVDINNHQSISTTTITTLEDRLHALEVCIIIIIEVTITFYTMFIS